MFGQGRIGPGHHDPEVAVVGSRGPHLLTVQDPLLAVPDGTGGEAGHVGPGTRFGEHLAPDGIAADVVREVDGLLVLGAELGEHRQAHAVRNGQRGVR